MGKFDLACHFEKEVDIYNNEFYVNGEKANSIQSDMQEQFANMHSSLININMLLNKAVKNKYVKGSRVGIYKGWAKRAKGQANIIDKLKKEVLKNYSKDLKTFSINDIDLKIVELEKRINSMKDK